jgi:hypothetical protein|tara:strand:- start:121 stop:273 length:153 start_codon:yes stop_codon:yes gene_type:complete
MGIEGPTGKIGYQNTQTFQYCKEVFTTNVEQAFYIIFCNLPWTHELEKQN